MVYTKIKKKLRILRFYSTVAEDVVFWNVTPYRWDFADVSEVRNAFTLQRSILEEKGPTSLRNVVKTPEPATQRRIPQDANSET